jgi:hypothetical protein
LMTPAFAGIAALVGGVVVVAVVHARACACTARR